MIYSENFRCKVITKLEERYSIRAVAVATQFEIDKNTTLSWKKRLEVKRIRPRKPSKIDNDALRADVEKYPE
ncbi:IS630 transposase-related protein [Acinetobacter nectaris]|uniref:IS630 transposase-related protein n=1 Tax=Acinetobacter nectaris TaxID=1219382 RepID=UPI001F28EA60|nr:IS630 transposase-related protein [Acinetobacter nectaris]